MDDSIIALRQPIRSKPRVTLNPWWRYYGCSDDAQSKFMCSSDWTTTVGLGATHQKAIESFARIEAKRLPSRARAEAFLAKLQSTTPRIGV